MNTSRLKLIVVIGLPLICLCVGFITGAYWQYSKNIRGSAELQFMHDDAYLSSDLKTISAIRDGKIASIISDLEFVAITRINYMAANKNLIPVIYSGNYKMLSIKPLHNYMEKYPNSSLIYKGKTAISEIIGKYESTRQASN